MQEVYLVDSIVNGASCFLSVWDDKDVACKFACTELIKDILKNWDLNDQNILFLAQQIDFDIINLNYNFALFKYNNCTSNMVTKTSIVITTKVINDILSVPIINPLFPNNGPTYLYTTPIPSAVSLPTGFGNLGNISISGSTGNATKTVKIPSSNPLPKPAPISGATCIKCNQYNEYIISPTNDEKYLCRSCKMFYSIFTNYVK